MTHTAIFRHRNAPRRGAAKGLATRAALPAALAGLALAGLALGGPAQAQEHKGGIQAQTGNADLAPFDIIHAKIATEGSHAVFHMAVAGEAGDAYPTALGTLAGSGGFAYVWPTTIDAAEVGFESGAGILSMAVTAHPDFDDTPLFDENGDGDTTNDGNVWHSHWVVLGPDEACGPGTLKVIDIPEGATPALPKTWPGLPLLIDSPGWQPLFDDETVEVRVAFDDIGAAEAARFDGVTAGLRVNADLHAPLLCVVDVFDTASDDLGLPGEVNR
jgi:hypothetical protein